VHARAGHVWARVAPKSCVERANSVIKNCPVFRAPQCIMSAEVPCENSRSELPHALAAAIVSQKRNFWGICAVRRPQSLARYDFLSHLYRVISPLILTDRLCYLINDTVTIGSAPFAGKSPRPASRTLLICSFRQMCNCLVCPPFTLSYAEIQVMVRLE
jgi:hypothetical protein